MRLEKTRRSTELRESTPVPAPKRSTLGVVALGSVEELCSGIESNISINKDTHMHYAFSQYISRQLQVREEMPFRSNNI